MSWIFGGKKKKASGSRDVDEPKQKKKNKNDDFLLGAATDDVDYLQSGGHSKGDETLYANELAELGFDIEPGDPMPSAVERPKREPNLLDVDLSPYHVPELSEEDMQLTEEDMNDPELLEAFSSMAMDGGATDSAESDHMDLLPESKQPTDIPDTEGMDIGSLQTLALSLTNEGRKQEALEVMKRVRYLKYADKIQDTVDAARNISMPVADTAPEAFPPACGPYGYASDAKQMALRLKKAGHQGEAIQWLRYAKQVEGGAPIVSREDAAPIVAPTVATNEPTAQEKKVSSNSSPPRAVERVTSLPRALSSANSAAGVADAFSPLMAALEEAISYHFKKASAANKDLQALTADEESNSDKTGKAKSAAYTALRSKYRASATEQMKLYKMYTQELAVLQSRRSTPGLSPPLFRWETTQISTPVENTYLGEDQIELVVNGARDMEVLLSGHGHRSISISYNMGIPRDDPATGHIPAKRYVDEIGCVWDFKVVLPFKRGRSLNKLLERKKIIFEIILHRGMFSGGDVTLGMVSLPLVELLTKTTTGGDALPLTKEGRGRGIGGVLSAYAKVRVPIDGPEVRITEERQLVVLPWPDVVTSLPAEGSGIKPADDARTPDEGTVASPIEAPAAAALTATASVGPGNSHEHVAKQLSEKEIQDPFSVDFLISNDVMDTELESLRAELTQCADPDEKFNIKFRYDMVERNLNILVMHVQNESLSLEDYLNTLRDRLKRDQFMALYFKNSGETNTALKIMKRIKIMSEELKNAEGGS